MNVNSGNRVPEGEPVLEEIDKFKGLLFAVLSTGQDYYVSCSDAHEAKNLRKRLYRLRSSLDVLSRDAADSVVFTLVGHKVRCSKRTNSRRLTSPEWTENVQTGAPDATQD